MHSHNTMKWHLPSVRAQMFIVMDYIPKHVIQLEMLNETHFTLQVYFNVSEKKWKLHE